MLFGPGNQALSRVYWMKQRELLQAWDLHIHYSGSRRCNDSAVAASGVLLEDGII
jgi:hypothetical protein